jgi:HEAT repeat protein
MESKARTKWSWSVIAGAAAALMMCGAPAIAQVSVGVGGGVSGGVSRGVGSGFAAGPSAGIGGGVSGGISSGVSVGVSGGVYGGPGWREADEQNREDELYNDATDAIDEGKWDRAVERFQRVIDMHGKRADAATYYKAYALNKLGRRQESLAAIADLEKTYPKSKWVNDAKALEIEVKQASGVTVSPESQSDCELKLLALQGLQQADPERAIPILEKMLKGDACPKVGQQALFVLAQSSSQQARDVMAKIARGEMNPELQRKAIQNLGLFGGENGRRVLEQIYSSIGDSDMKVRVLNAFMLSGARQQLLNVAKSEKDPHLRGEAIKQMGLMGAREDIWQMYQQEQDVQVKKEILQALFLAGDREHVAQLAKNEKDRTMKLAAINDLGLMGRQSDQMLMEIYNSDPDPEIRKKVLNSIFLAGDRERMAELAKNEKDRTTKLAAINYLGLMGRESDAVLMEIYNSDPDPEIRKKVLNSIFLANDRERMGELAKNEKDKTTKLAAINYLGLMGKSSDDILMGIYNTDSDTDVKKKVINALFLANDAHGLVELARKESDPSMKKTIISQLSIMNSKEATDYLMEILNK